MDKLTAIKIKYDDGTYSDEIPISVFSENVEWDNTLSLVDILGQVDTSESIQDQINNLKNTRATNNAINSEASTRALADSNLQSQINQIVAPSGEAPSAAEVQNARIGADGVTYDTLGTAIRTQVNNLNDGLCVLAKDNRTEKTLWDMTDFFGWPTATNEIYAYTIPINKGDVIVSITLQPSSNYHNNGSVYLLYKQNDTQFILIKKYENITTATLNLNYICREDTYIAISGEYVTNITQQTGFVPLQQLKTDYSVDGDAHQFSYTSKVIILQKDERASNNSFFDVGEGCKYTNIQDAITDMPENSVIHVKNGIYYYGIDARTKNVTVIGESKENCVIEFDNKTYGDNPVFIGIGIWKNLTFRVVENKSSSTYSRIKDLTPAQRAYAVHIDHFGSDREIIFENCYFYSELNSAVGIGLKKNVTLKFVRCDFETTADIEAIICHDCAYDYLGDNQILVLDTCNLRAKGCQYVFNTEDEGYTDKGNKMYYRFYRNILWSDVNGKDNVIKTVGASGNGWKGTSVVTLTGDSYGNNIPDMNA